MTGHACPANIYCCTYEIMIVVCPSKRKDGIALGFYLIPPLFPLPLLLPLSSPLLLPTLTLLNGDFRLDKLCLEEGDKNLRPPK